MGGMLAWFGLTLLQLSPVIVLAAILSWGLARLLKGHEPPR